MKTVKKILVLMLAITMLFALPITAYADETYTITIKNNSSAVSMEGNTYNAYKVFDLTLSGYDANSENPANYAYTVSEAFADFSYTVNSVTYTGDYDTDSTKSLVSFFTGIDDNSDELNAFAKAVKEYIENESVSSAGTVTATAADEAVINVTSLGYYIILGEAKSTDGSDESVVAFASLDTTNNNAEVNLKADAPTVTKKVKEDDDTSYASYADGTINEKFDFLITSTIPDYASYYDEYTYIIHDSMEKGLTLDKNTIKLYSDAALTTEIAAGNYTVSYPAETDSVTDNHTFDITIDSNYFTDDTDGTTIYVYYQATLNKDAEIYGDANTNTVYVEYSNDAYDEDFTGKTTESEVNVYSYSFDVFKYTGTETGLANAEFKLYSDAACTSEIAVVSTTGTIEGVNEYRVAESSETGVTIVSPASGKITINGLDSGTYYLKETKAPSGYNQLENAIKVEITAEANATSTEVESVKIKQDDREATEIKVLNNSGTLLPFTGDTGTILIYILGGICVISAGIFLITSKRVSNKKNKE